MRPSQSRIGQQRFKTKLQIRHDSQCAVCDMAEASLLDGVHIKPYALNGTDDARNGLILCALQHRAFDAGLFGIAPSTLSLGFRERGPEPSDLNITRSDITHLSNRPHEEALNWHWENVFREK